jgi:branched-chain amino acid transport system substrate-binding protein
MSKLFRTLLLAAALLAAPPAFAEQGVTDHTITFGAFGPITGPAAYIGLGGRDGAALALKEINAAGGVNGRQLAMVFEDDGHSPTRALAAVKKLLDQDQVFFLLSLSGSNAVVGTLDYAKQSGRVLYVSIASAPGVTWPFSRTMFRGGTAEVPRYGELYAEYIVDYLKAKKIAIISGREEYPKNEGDALTKQLQSWFAITPVKRVEFNIGDKDFTPQLLEVQQSAPDVIAFFGNPAEAAIAFRQARELGIDQPFFVGSNMVDASLLSAAHKNAEGVSGFALVPALPGSNDPDLKAWEAKWKAEYPNLPAGRPNVFDLIGYADMYVLAQALKQAGPEPTTDKLVTALESLNGYRVSPIATPRTFTAKHHIGNLTLQAQQVKNGAWEPVPWQPKHETEILKRYQ